MPRSLDPHKIAIVIPLYNDAPNIERAIASALAQTLPAPYTREVFVVDDCSTDNGCDLAERMAETQPDLTIIRQSVNQGPSAARNAALALTDAGWFTPQDSDDFVEPDRLSKLLAIALDNELDWVADNLLISMQATPQQVERPLWPEKPDGPVVLTAPFFVRRSFDNETARSELGFLKPLFNRQALAGGPEPYRNDLRFGEDFELYTRLLLDGTKAWLVDPCGYYLVQRENSASHSQAGRDHRRLARISSDMSKLPGLPQDTRRALRDHADYSRKEAAMWSLIDGVRARNPRLALLAFGFSPGASLHVLRELTTTAWRRLTAS